MTPPRYDAPDMTPLLLRCGAPKHELGTYTACGALGSNKGNIKQKQLVNL